VTGATAAPGNDAVVASFGMSAAVFALTTPIDDLLTELERRGARGRRGRISSSFGAWGDPAHGSSAPARWSMPSGRAVWIF